MKNIRQTFTQNTSLTVFGITLIAVAFIDTVFKANSLSSNFTLLKQSFAGAAYALICWTVLRKFCNPVCDWVEKWAIPIAVIIIIVVFTHISAFMLLALITIFVPSTIDRWKIIGDRALCIIRRKKDPTQT